MRYFSYKDYMDYKGNIDMNNYGRVEEEKAEYILEDGEINSQFEIIEILKNIEDLQDFLNEFVWADEPIKQNDITYYNANQTTQENQIMYYDENENFEKSNYENMITCKIKSKEIFVIIKELHEIDLNIIYKMLEYSLKIIKGCEQNMLQNVRNPIVIPIVIYTGNKKWNTNNYQLKQKINYIEFKSNSINFAYNLIKINELGNSELKKMKSKVAKKMLKIKKINIYK